MQPQILCQYRAFLKSFNTLIPEKPLKEWLLKPGAFSRDRKLPFAQLVAFCLAQAGTPDKNGTTISIGRFVRSATRSGLWPQAELVDKSSIARARSKISWKAFHALFEEVIKMAYSMWEDKPWHTWHDMSVFAIDGSKFQLPASAEIRKEFDTRAPHTAQWNGHYPQCLVSTAFDVFRRIPVGRVIEKVYSSEREHAMQLLGHIPQGGVVMMDRGYPSYELIKTFHEKYDSGFYVMRCCGSNTFPAVVQFLKSSQQQATIQIKPSDRYRAKNPGQNAPMLSVRVMRLISPDGTISAILTNLPTQQFTKEEITVLYYRRWEVENYYRDEKITMELQTFHSKNSNGVRQELFCATIISVLTRVMTMLCSKGEKSKRIEPQFKNALTVLTEDITILVTKAPKVALKALGVMTNAIRKVKHYRPNKKRPIQLRITKRPPNKWIYNRGKTISNHNMALSNLKCQR